MIVINVTIKHNDIIAAVEALTEAKFTFVKKDKMKLYFECDNNDLEAMAKVVKNRLKTDPIFGILYFQVTTA
ncbi:hypothetical protein HYG86_04245 [Alkalicella caledoniensis]|uniref:Uncharacterized protein n=1 Tax=Alkalicella caledoniensis TaxID=2731377 RepID=A0A7G9W5S6_ALKCA|nr:hypothetical protein [Alkalicella caledoniensis]QNO14038.1 hypothetical protein HYG86_04245 [Alkalicella caledoniensis]